MTSERSRGEAREDSGEFIFEPGQAVSIVSIFIMYLVGIDSQLKNGYLQFNSVQSLSRI